MKRHFNLGTEDWPGAAGVVPFRLSPIPDEYMSDSYRVARLYLDVRMDITTGNAGDFDADEQYQWLTLILLRASEETIVSLSGWDLVNFLFYSHTGLNIAGAFPADIGVDETNLIQHLQLEIPLENAMQVEPQDYVCPASLFNDADLQVTFGGAAPGTDTVINAATITVWAQVERKNEIQIPAFPCIMSKHDSLFSETQPGIYDNCFIMPRDGDAFAAADVTAVMMSASGEVIHGGVGPDGVIQGYTWDHGVGLMMNTAFAKDYATITHLPLIWQGWNARSNRVSQLIDSGGVPLVYNLVGAPAADLKWVYRYYRPITREGLAQRFGKMGAANPSAVLQKPKSLSKTVVGEPTIRTRTGLRIIPRKIVGEKVPGALGRLEHRFVQPSISARPKTYLERG
jgi:hypothetical protein